jgi:hypothetical protein
LVALRESIGEAAPRGRRDVRCIPPPNEMRPQRNVRTRDIAPGDIQPLMPVVERLIIGTLETRPAQPKGLKVGTLRGHDNFGGHVRGIGNVARGRHFPANGRRAHHGRRLSGSVTTSTARSRRRPARFGRSKISGL